jgi:uncharacterized protein (TIGR02246 family)
MFYKSATLAALAAVSLVSAQAQQLRTVDTRSNANETYQQPSDRDNLKTIAANLNTQRGQLFAHKDANGIANLYTPNAIYVELLPYLLVMTGRQQIADHLRAVFDANATELSPTVTEAHMVDQTTQVASGDYTLTLRNNRQIMGHFVQTLKLENGTWRIASHIFARPEAITMQEMSYR